MRVVPLDSKNRIEGCLRRDPWLHFYEIGDLDDFFWPQTAWFGAEEGPEITEIALLYSGLELPTLLALSREPVDPMRAILRSIGPTLPQRFYAHLSPGLATEFEDRHKLEPHGPHLKMGLMHPALLPDLDPSGVERLTPQDAPALEALYGVSYPGNWFRPRMLETGQYYGVREQGNVVAVAGVHVYSPRYRIAALGNVATHPEWRGRGLAGRACARLCRELLLSVDHIGLNVKADNAHAISCYKRLGFRPAAAYEEWMIS